MTDRSSQQLLKEYVNGKSDQAFAELVQRHFSLVYGTAYRLLKNAQWAEDVTQRVFITLAKEAPKLIHHTNLSGWLHTTTHNAAVMVIRSENRRQLREQKAAEMNAPGGDLKLFWDQMESVVDEALIQLRDNDRELILSRFFEGKSCHEIANTTGASEGAVHKRISRALERLRQLIAKRGLIIPTTVLASVLSAYATTPLPASSASAITSILTKAQHVEPAVSSSFSLLKFLCHWKLKPASTAVAVVGCLTLGSGGFVAGRTAAEKHHAAQAWQELLLPGETSSRKGQTTDRAQTTTSPDRPTKAPDSLSARQILARAADYFRAREFDPDAWAKGMVQLEALQSADLTEALNGLESYRSESAVYNSMAPTILGLWAQTQPQEAIGYALSHLQQNSRSLALEYILKSWSTHDPKSSWAWFQQNSQSGSLPIAQDTWRWLPQDIFNEWAANDPRAAFAVYQKLNYADEQAAMSGIINATMEPNLRPAILNEVNQLTDENQRKRLSIKLASKWARHDPEAATEWASTVEFSNPAAQLQLYGEIIEEWWRIDPHAATRWLITSAPTQVKNSLLHFVKSSPQP